MVTSIGIINSGMIGACAPIGPFGISSSGATGATGPTGASLNNVMVAYSSGGGHATPPMPFEPDITRLRVKIRPHRRMYRTDFLSDKQMEFAKNRLIVTVPREYYQQNAHNVIEQYAEWLDDHLAAAYSIEENVPHNCFILSFESEADMVQFVLSFR